MIKTGLVVWAKEVFKLLQKMIAHTKNKIAVTRLLTDVITITIVSFINSLAVDFVVEFLNQAKF